MAVCMKVWFGHVRLKWSTIAALSSLDMGWFVDGWFSIELTRKPEIEIIAIRMIAAKILNAMRFSLSFSS